MHSKKYMEKVYSGLQIMEINTSVIAIIPASTGNFQFLIFN
jgi:hypothetical protein